MQALAADGTEVELPSASQRRLLGILAIHAPRRLRAEWLADELQVSLGALRTTVSRLRSSIGADALVTTTTGYAIDADVDAARFTASVAEAATAADPIDALQRALDLWGGPALDEFRGEEWAGGEIARLTEIQAGTVDDLSEAFVDAGRSAEAVALLERQVVDHPYRDRSRGLLIRALACGGRQGDALRAFQDYRTRLVDDLGIEPSPDVARIERRVATGWTGVERDPRDASPEDRLEVPMPRLLAPDAAFVGRATEMAVLADGLAAVPSSKLTGVVLTGEPGIGKTSLLSAFAGSVAASSGATVLYGRCEETGVPIEPFGTILRLVVEHATRELLAGHVVRCGGDLLHVCPTLRSRIETTPEPSRSDTATERFLVFEAATDLLRRAAARQPLVLMLDDLQWAEPTALLLLRHLVRALADEPVLLVLACRDPEEHGREELRMALAEIQRGGLRRVGVPGLDRADLAELAATSMHGSDKADVDAVVGALHRDTAGNPLYATQLIQHWNETGADGLPTSLRDLVWSRVRSLGGDVPDVLTSAAVLGTEFDEEVLSDMLDLPDPIVGDAIDQATAAGLLYDADSARRSVRFVHTLVAGALYSDLGGSRRARLHERAARALEKRYDDVPPDVVVQLARHTRLSGQAAEALRWATLAGNQAFEQLAPIEAAEHFRVALETAIELGRPTDVQAELLVRLGEAEHRAGDPGALETLERAADLARSAGADATTIRAAIAADRGFMRVDTRATTYLDLVEAAVEVADPADVPTYAQLLALLSQDLLYTPESHRRFELATEALELATASDDPVLLARIAAPILFALWAPGSGPLRTRIAAEAGAAAEASGDPRLEFALQYTTYDVAIETADHVAAARSLAKARAIARDLGEPRMLWTVSLFDTFEATMAGRLAEAEALSNRGLELGMQIGEADAFTIFAGQFYTLGTFAGRHADLLPLVEQTVQENPGFIPFQSAYAILCAAVGRTAEAQAWLDEGIANGVEHLPLDNMWTTSAISYAVLTVELEDRAAAAELLPVIAPHADEVAFNGVTSQGPIAAYVGKLASLVGEHDLAEDHLQAALATADAFGWRYHRATTLFALAQARQRRLGRLDRVARAQLTESAELCRAGGFNSWLPQVEALAG